MNLNDLKTGRKVKALWKGPPVTRKTTSFMSLPGRKYVFDWDHKIESALKAGFPIEGEVEFDRYDHDNAMKAKEKIHNLLAKNPYDAILWDSITSTSSALVRYSWDNNKSSRKKMVGGQWIPGFQEFNVESGGLADILAFGFQLKCHFILTAHLIEVSKPKLTWNKEANDYDSEDVISRTIITAGKKLAESIPARFAEIWHFDREPWPDTSKEPRYYVSTRNSGEDFAASALPLKDKIYFDDKPLWPMIVQMCKEKGVEIG
jgi:hypothetical protein